MTKIEIILSIADLKKVLLPGDSYCFYLRIKFFDWEPFITQTKNLLYEEASFCFETYGKAFTVEVWDYDEEKKVGEIKLKNLNSETVYSHSFKRANITTKVRTLKRNIAGCC